LSDETLRELLEVQAHFRLPSVALVEKDLHVVRGIAALAAIDAAPFGLVFGGGTALARAHRLVRRMSEDVDFKIVPRAAPPVSRSALRRQLDRLRGRVSQALLDAGFAFDPAEKSVAWARDEGRYAVWQLPYDASGGTGKGLRPTIKVELNYAPMRCSAVTLPVRSFVAEAFERSPEVPAVACARTAATPELAATNAKHALESWTRLT
jgi:hypothetical protein